jgi:CRP/FNR family transcriptional regulator
VAAFLVAVSRNNMYEGRDANAVPDFLSSGFVADLLGLSIDLLADVLRSLAKLDIVQPSKVAGLLITDLAALERLADAH